MEYEIANQARNFTLTPELEGRVAGEARRLDRLVASFPPDATHLRVIIDDEAGRGNPVEVTLRLSLPGRMLTAHQAGPFPAAVDHAFDELRRQLVEYKELLRREHEYKRKRLK